MCLEVICIVHSSLVESVDDARWDEVRPRAKNEFEQRKCKADGQYLFS